MSVTIIGTSSWMAVEEIKTGEIKTPRAGRKSKRQKPASSGVGINDFSGLDPTKSKQNAKTKPEKTREYRAAAAALLRSALWGS
ncbi:MAG: hypothetical protein Q8M47_13005 [Devosia sp.]|nr:hypothetical protein [Devosia sp.]